MPLRLALCLFLLTVPAISSAASPPDSTDAVAAVRQSIDALFDAMRAGDGEAVRRVFAENATLETAVAAPDSVRAATGRSTVVRAGSVEGFAEAVDEPKDEVWDERIWDVEIRVDGRMAAAWVPYAFYLGDALQHCGVNAIQLVRQPDGWKMLHLVDTRTPAPECTVPESAAKP